MRVVYAGTGEIGLPTLDRLITDAAHEVVGVITQPDRPSGRGKQVHFGPIKSCALEASIPVLQPEKASSPEALEELRRLGPEVVIVFAYGQILRPAFLELPEKGCYNLHASLLPRHRGAACIQAAILDGDPITGLTLMKVAEGLDTGDICLQRKLEIIPGETAGELHDRIADLGPDLLIQGLEQLAAGTLPSIPQEEDRASYARRIKKEEGEIDWSLPAGEIEKRVRAFSPWPGAFTWAVEMGKPVRLAIWPPVDVVERESGARAGTLLEAGADGLLVACGKGCLRIHEIQRAGKKRMPVQDYLRGHALEPGFRLGV
jgi:methionyl-tRNA formyltransferase